MSFSGVELSQSLKVFSVPSNPALDGNRKNRPFVLTEPRRKAVFNAGGFV
jgi:hypothetical protein